MRKDNKIINLLNFGFGSLLMIIGVLFLPFVVGIYLIFLGWGLYLGIVMTTTPKDFTDPVSSETLVYLCSELDLANTNRICQPETVIYADELEAVFEETLLKKRVTYEEAQAILEEFQRWETDASADVRENSDGRKYFMEQYDFVGDDEVLINFYFNEFDRQLFDISVYIPRLDD